MGAEEGASPKPPAWLPEGWTMKVNRRKGGRIDKYYISPLSGCTCRSRPEVMRILNMEKEGGLPLETTVLPEEDRNCPRPEVMHLNVKKDDPSPLVTTMPSEEDKNCSTPEVIHLLSVEKDDGPTLGTTASSEDDKNCDVDQRKDLATWLPSGWILEIKTHKTGTSAGKNYKSYFNPSTGSRFYTKAEVFRYLKTGECSKSTLNGKILSDKKLKKKHLGSRASNKRSINTNANDNQPRLEVMHLNVEKDDAPHLVTTASSEEDKNNDVDQRKDSVTWLPSGWIVEIKTHKTGASAGKNYKCYYNPETGSRFYTRAEVFRYLKTEESSKSMLNEKMPNDPELKKKQFGSSTSNQKNINTDSIDNNLSVVETSPDGLPSGWIKEIKYTKNASGVRRDPYYTDPVSGYVFRSKKDALRYIETGEISKYAFKPRAKSSTSKTHFIENDSPSPVSAKELKGQGDGTTIRRHLFAGKVHKSNGKSRKTTQDSDELVVESSFSQPSDLSALKRKRGNGPRYNDLSSSVRLKHQQAKVINQTLSGAIDLHENGLPDKLLEPAEEKALDQVIEKLLDSVGKRSPGSSDGKLLHSGTEDLRSLSNVEWFEAKGKETAKPADKILPQSSKPVEDHAKPPSKKSEFEDANVQMTAEQKSVGLPESMCNELSRRVDGKTSGKGTKESQKEGTNRKIESTQPRLSKAKSKKPMPIARRASKRLAGLEADAAADIEVSDRSLKRGKQSTRSEASSAKISLKENREVEAQHQKLQDKPIREKFNLEEQHGDGGTTYQEPESPMASPFGDSWPDPCIEFAFKTLTGQIPILDTTTIQGYLDEQPPSVQAPTTPDHPTHPSVGCSNGQDKSGIQMQVDPTREEETLLEASPPVSGRVKRLCRRSITRKTATRD